VPLIAHHKKDRSPRESAPLTTASLNAPCCKLRVSRLLGKESNSRRRRGCLNTGRTIGSQASLRASRTALHALSRVPVAIPPRALFFLGRLSGSRQCHALWRASSVVMDHKAAILRHRVRRTEGIELQSLRDSPDLASQHPANRV
jgi:hypothetical protein